MNFLARFHDLCIFVLWEPRKWLEEIQAEELVQPEADAIYK